MLWPEFDSLSNVNQYYTPYNIGFMTAWCKYVWCKSSPCKCTHAWLYVIGCKMILLIHALAQWLSRLHSNKLPCLVDNLKNMHELTMSVRLQIKITPRVCTDWFLKEHSSGVSFDFTTGLILCQLSISLTRPMHGIWNMPLLCGTHLSWRTSAVWWALFIHMKVIIMSSCLFDQHPQQ